MVGLIPPTNYCRLLKKRQKPGCCESRLPELSIQLDMNVEWGARDNVPPSEGRGMICEWAVDGGVKVSWTPAG